MAAPTISSKGVNKPVMAAVANYVFDATVAGTYASTVEVPNGATILSIATKTNVALTTGTSFLVKVDGVTVSAAIVLTSTNAIGKYSVQAPVLPHTIGTSADNAGGGAISITTTGTYGAGDVDIVVAYTL